MRAAAPIDAELILREARITAAQLVRSRRIGPSDCEDMAGDLIVGCIRRARRFDPVRASFATFTAMAIGCAAMSALRRRSAIKRRPVRSSCEPPVQHEFAHLEFDLRDAVGRLPRDLRTVCDALAGHSLSESARRLGVSRNALRRRIAQIRAAFVAAGWEGIS